MFRAAQRPSLSRPASLSGPAPRTRLGPSVRDASCASAASLAVSRDVCGRSAGLVPGSPVRELARASLQSLRGRGDQAAPPAGRPVDPLRAGASRLAGLSNGAGDRRQASDRSDWYIALRSPECAGSLNGRSRPSTASPLKPCSRVRPCRVRAWHERSPGPGKASGSALLRKPARLT